MWEERAGSERRERRGACAACTCDGGCKQWRCVCAVGCKQWSSLYCSKASSRQKSSGGGGGGGRSRTGVDRQKVFPTLVRMRFRMRWVTSIRL